MDNGHTHVATPDTSVEMRLSNREKIAVLEAALKEMPQTELAIVNRFAKGPNGVSVYAREMFAPAGTLAVGKIHKYENISIISKGSFSVYTEAGEVLRITAPYTWVAPPGTKRACYFHEDTIWTNVHASAHTDMDALEEELIAKDFDDPVLLERAIEAFKKLEG
jgi:hypothetical protein